MPVTAGGVVANVLLLRRGCRSGELRSPSTRSAGRYRRGVLLPLRAVPDPAHAALDDELGRARRRRGVVALALVAVAMGLHCNAWDVYAYTNPPVRSGEFVLGVLMAELVARGWRPPDQAARRPDPARRRAGRARTARRCARAVGGRRAARPVLRARHPRRRARRAWGTPGVLQHRAMTYLGEVSFAFYLVHELAILNLAPHLADGGGLGGIARHGSAPARRLRQHRWRCTTPSSALPNVPCARGGAAAVRRVVTDWCGAGAARGWLAGP